MIEQLEPLFLEGEFQQQTALIRGQKMFRVEVGAGRHYRLEDGRTFKSLTTFLDAVLPQSKHLQGWREQKIEELGSVDKMWEFVQATADYGTALHIAMAEYCRNNGVVWADFDRWVFDYLTMMEMAADTLSAAQTEITKDFAAILQFFHDYEVRVIAVEIPVWLDAGTATLIDLVCEMNAKCYTEATPPEKRQRIRASGNLKSGKKGFHESHLFQLEGERRMWNETYGEIYGEIQHVFNLSPKNWQKKPTYDFKLQTDTIEAQKIPEQFTLALQWATIRNVLSTPKREFTVFLGETKFGESPVGAMAVLNYDEYAGRKIAEYAPMEPETEEAEVWPDVLQEVHPTENGKQF